MEIVFTLATWACSLCKRFIFCVSASPTLVLPLTHMRMKSENYIKYDLHKDLLVNYHAREEKVPIQIKIRVSTYDKSVESLED